MKKLIIAIPILLTICLCCGRSKRLPSGWEESGNPLADTMTMRLEHDYGHNSGAANDRWLAPLESIAKADTDNPRIGARAAYWRVRQQLRRGEGEKAKSILDSAMSSLDSAKYADDFIISRC